MLLSTAASIILIKTILAAAIFGIDVAVKQRNELSDVNV